MNKTIESTGDHYDHHLEVNAAIIAEMARSIAEVPCEENRFVGLLMYRAANISLKLKLRCHQLVSNGQSYAKAGRWLGIGAYTVKYHFDSVNDYINDAYSDRPAPALDECYKLITDACKMSLSESKAYIRAMLKIKARQLQHIGS